MEKNVFKEEREFHIYLLNNENNYLVGLLEGYCASSIFQVKLFDDYSSFFKAFKKNTPSLVFINISEASRLSSLLEWATIQQFMKENDIQLCGIGDQTFDNGGGLVCNKIFPEPCCDDEILSFLQERLAVNGMENKERRFIERRKESNRRNCTQTDKTRKGSLVSTNTPYLDQQKTENIIRVGSLVINHSHKVIKINDIPVDLSPKEFAIMTVLANNLGQVVKTEELIKSVWPKDFKATKADVYQYMHMLRKKIEIDATHPKIIITVKGFGYELRSGN